MIRWVCTSIGLLTLPAGAVLALAIYSVRGGLPAATVGTTGMNVLVGVLAAFFCCCAGITLVAGRICVVDDYLDLEFASKVRRVLGVLFAAVLVTSGLASIMFIATALASQGWDPAKRFDLNTETIGYLLLLVAPFPLTLANSVTGWAVLRAPKQKWMSYYVSPPPQL